MSVDESGVNLSMTRRYSWSRSGEPAFGDVPVDRGKNQTLTGAVRADGGLVASMQVGGGTTSDVFVAYVTQVLGPALRPGDVVVLDDPSSHETPAVRAAFEAAKVEVLYLPRYSPEHNPTESMWAAVKRELRSVAARTAVALDAAITRAPASVDAKAVQGWFRHCGYCTEGL